MKTLLLIIVFNLFLLTPADSQTGRDIDNLLPLKRQVELYNNNLAWKLDSILPQIIRREKIDM